MAFDPDLDDYSQPAPRRVASRPSQSSQPSHSAVVIPQSLAEQCRREGKTLTQLCLEVTGGKDQIH